MSGGLFLSETRASFHRLHPLKVAMIVMRFRVRPTIVNPKYSEIAEALANVLVDTDDDKAAEKRARVYLIRRHWMIESLEEIGEVKDREDFQNDKKSTDMFDRAVKYSIFCVIAGSQPGSDVPRSKEQ